MLKIATRLFLLFAGMIIFSSFTAAFAYDDCYRDCMNQSGCLNPEPGVNVSYCSDTQARCSSDCLDKGPSAPSGGKKIYGAIAYSKRNGAYGYSHGWTNRKKAEKVAVKNCSENGKGCKSVVWFYNSCGAVASDGKHVTWGRSSVRQIAKQEALDKCNKSWFNGKCESVVSSCSG